MCTPTNVIRIPRGLSHSCDAVASFYLHDRTPAQQKLFQTADVEFFQKRQDLIERLKEAAYRDHNVKSTLDMWLWGKSRVTEIWTERTLASLQGDLQSVATTDGTQWSLQLLPQSFSQAGHHMAFGKSPNKVNWWLLDPATAMYTFDKVEDLACFLQKHLTESAGLNAATRTVLLRID
ncbi:hypothetical protein [Paraburkholderia sp. J10-1]|uniref:hypothetical protein n=1 Tax=Paraburkholderia sp. J10-1 TaxID=2805430 RepID=UPI002AB63821|nr:hypothetical protein [Paraburkholderia sp. J10-1]